MKNVKYEKKAKAKLGSFHAFFSYCGRRKQGFFSVSV